MLFLILKRIEALMLLVPVRSWYIYHMEPERKLCKFSTKLYLQFFEKLRKARTSCLKGCSTKTQMQNLLLAHNSTTKCIAGRLKHSG